MEAEKICDTKTTITLDSLEVLDFIQMLRQDAKIALNWGMPEVANALSNVYSDFCNMVENSKK